MPSEERLFRYGSLLHGFKTVAYPCCYADMIQCFGKPVPELCRITNTMLDWIFDNHSHRILNWNANVLNSHFIEVYANAIQRKGAPLPNCFGFVDGTVRPISRPGKIKGWFTMDTNVHSLKFQSLALPSGLIGHMYGPVGMPSLTILLYIKKQTIL